jgi:hypothetical protein
MSHTIQAYADYCGIKKLSKPYLSDSFYPICFDKYLVLHTPAKSSDISHYNHWNIVLQSLKPFLESEGIKLVQIQIGPETDTNFNLSDLILSNLTFQQISYIISKSEGYIGVDNVLMHMASMHDKKIVGLFADQYPEVNKPIWNSSSSVTCLSPDFSKLKPFFGRGANKKRINEIMPESIVSAVIKLVKGSCPNIPMESIHIGENYHLPIVEIIPDFFNNGMIRPDRSANIRADIHFDSTNILNWCSTRRCNLFLNSNQIKDISFISQVKKNINQINLFADMEVDIDDVKKLSKTGIKIFLLCKDKDILDAVRLKLIDWSVDLFSPKTKKDIDKIDQVSYTTTKFNSTKVVLSKNSKYPSLYHALKKESSVNVLFDNDLFWSDIDHFYIYNNHHAKRTTKKNTRRSSSFRNKSRSKA